MGQISSQNLRQKYVFNVAKANVFNNFCALIASDNHLIFTNQKNLLYGDYFIDPQPNPDFMGTTIAFGSDEFKTWEEVITFFERLGGQ